MEAPEWSQDISPATQTQTQTQQLGYRGKHFTVPTFSAGGFVVEPQPTDHRVEFPNDSPILAALNSTWDLQQFKVPRRPLSLGVIPPVEQALFSQPGMPRSLDMPIKFPGSAFRVPKEFEQLRPLIQRIANCEAAINSRCYDEYYAYLTVDQGRVKPGTLQREAPCHVDGFQGARWKPKVRINHTYVISDGLPTAYYEQPFELDALDESRHNFFWEFNRQVAATNSVHAWSPAPYELNLMDAYTVHRGTPASVETFRTWVRLSFEVRIFDRLGNAHNPLFTYDWSMVPRDIEGLGLVPFDPEMDASLRVFPWQKLDGTPHEPGGRTQPNLKPQG
jgi:hypothetical protein